MEQEQLLNRFQKDSEWFYQNIDNLREQGYTEKFVAIKDSKLVASDKNINALMENLEESGEDPSFLFIEFIYSKEYVLIL